MSRPGGDTVPPPTRWEAPSGQTSPARKRIPAWVWLGLGILLVFALAAAAVAVSVSSSSAPRAVTPTVPGTSAPIVGGELHTVTAVDEALVVAGHTAAALTRDGGDTWQDIPSLTGADPMGWAVTPDAVFAAGHPGLFRSTDGLATFEAVPVLDGVSDTHALGGAGDTLYLGSPQAGLLRSVDGGETWQVQSEDAGGSFMGTILVDPDNPDRLIASDMSAGLVGSVDGGLTWSSLGGPTGAMSVSWNPVDRQELFAVGMDGAAISTDGGETWQEAEVPAGTSAVAHSANGATVYAAALRGVEAIVYRSTDGGVSWEPTG